MYDTIIIGGGPAGLTAGLYLARAGYKTLILEKESIGGQIASTPKIENYPGLPGISGAEFASNLYDQVIAFGGEIDIDSVIEVEDGQVKTVKTEEKTYETKSIIIATGASHKRLNLEREEGYLGGGIHFCATCDGPFYKDKVVAVIGGANTAVTDSIFLSKLCKKVYLIYRKSSLRCEQTLEQELKSKENIEILYNTEVINLNGSDELTSIEIITENERKTLPIDGIFLAIGMSPSNKLALKEMTLDGNGYFLAENTLTNCPGIFVAGDCRSKKVRQLTTATSDGTIAALSAIEYLKSLN